MGLQKRLVWTYHYVCWPFKQMKVLSIFMLQQAHCNSGAQWEEHRFLCGNIFSISHLFIDHFSVTTAVLLRTVYSTTCRQVIKGNEMIPFAFKGWILKKTKKKKTFIPPHKDEALSTCSSSSSSSGWRFNLSPDEWPTASLSEAAEAEFKGNSVVRMQKFSGEKSSSHLICRSTGQKTRRNQKRHLISDGEINEKRHGSELHRKNLHVFILYRHFVLTHIDCRRERIEPHTIFYFKY